MARVALSASGLLTGPNALEAPPGALLEAENVQIVRPGIVEPRPGFNAHAFVPDGIAATDYRLRAILPAVNDVISYARHASTGASRWDWVTLTDQITGLPTPYDFASAEPRIALARGNVYVSGQTGTFKLTSETDTAAQQAGLWRPLTPFVGQSTYNNGAAIPNTSVYAVRALIMRRDANDVITRSPPSIATAHAVGVGAGTHWDPVPLVMLPSYAAVGDTVEIYRTKAVSGTDVKTVGAEFFLALSYTLVAADITAGYIGDGTSTSVTRCRVDDNSLGQPLYANATQDGATQENDPPPACLDHAWWQGCMWFANTRVQERLAIALTDADRTNDGLQYVDATNVSVTSGSPTITGFANTDGIHVGMAVSEFDSFVDRVDQLAGLWTGHTERQLYVISKTATTVTMSRNAAATDASVNLRFHDVVTFGYDPPVHMYATATQGQSVDGRWRFDVDPSDERATIQDLAYWAQFATKDTDYDAQVMISSFCADAFAVWPGQLLFEEDGIGTETSEAVPFSFTSTAPLAWEPQMSSWTTAAAMQPAARADSLRWSKQDEPEHVPATNVVYVGDDGAAILRIVPLSGALLVWTERGLYRVTGSPPSNWRLDLVDPEARLLCSNAVCVLSDRCYAWTDRGVVVTDGYSVQQISEPSVGVGYDSSELRQVAQVFDRGNEEHGAFMVARPQSRLVILGVPSTSGQEAAARLWVYCEATGAWTRWGLTPRCAATSPTGLLLLEGGISRYQLREEIGADAADLFDGSYSVTLTSVSPSVTITAAAAGLWVPKIGDVISSGTEGLFRITAVSGTTTFTLTLDRTGITDTTVTAYVSIVSSVAWAPVAIPGCIGGLLTDVTLEFREVQSSLFGVDFEDYAVRDGECYFGGRHDRDNTLRETLIDITLPTELTVTGISKLLRCMPSRQLARFGHLYPRFRIADPKLRWALCGAKLTVQPVSERVVR